VNLQERSAMRRKRMQSHRSRDFAEAERWDLEYWQKQTPEQRLSALVAIRKDVAMVEASRNTRKP
jgi:hypothetical protein